MRILALLPKDNPAQLPKASLFKFFAEFYSDVQQHRHTGAYRHHHVLGRAPDPPAVPVPAGNAYAPHTVLDSLLRASLRFLCPERSRHSGYAEAYPRRRLDEVPPVAIFSRLGSRAGGML